MKLDFFQKNKGFTLVESLVAIFILMVAIVAPMQIAYQGIAATNYAKNQMIAQYLAQDAAEYLLARKAEYDQEFPTADSTDWLTGRFNTCKVGTIPAENPALTNGNGCALNTDNLGAFIPGTLGDIQNWSCSGGVCPILYYNASSGIYSQKNTSGWTATSFSRNIQLYKATNEVRAFITVTWGSSLNAKKSFVFRVNYY